MKLNVFYFKKLCSVFLICATLMTSVVSHAQDEDVMFQGFDWNIFNNLPNGTSWYDVISQNSQTLSDAGFDMVWLPPSSDSAAPQGYLPRELYNFSSAYGTEAELRSLINALHQKDIRAIADIVINHRVGTTDAVTFTNPDWPTFFITADDEGRNFVNGPVEFSINGDYFPGALKADGSNGTFAAARDLDHFNPAVRQEIITWMQFLRNDLGYDGWRYDFVHGYDPIFNKEYNDATQPYFAVGELLESGRFQTELWVDLTQQSSSAFDFNTKVALQGAVRFNNYSFLRDGNGNASGMIGNKPFKSVTFLDNHDTGEAQQCCGSNFIFPGGEANLRKGYAYILTHPGVPMVFWPHYFDNGAGVREAINDLISIRKDIRIHSGTSMNIEEARNDLYAAYIDGRNGTIAMKLGPADWAPFGDGWTLRTSGVDYAVWTQGGSNNDDDDTDNDDDNNTGQPFTVFAKDFSTVYTWENNQATSGQWPGAAMQPIGNGWFEAEVPGDCTNIIFNNNGSGQTNDLNTCSATPYFSNGQFVANPPSDFPNANGTDTITVYAKDFTTVYTWENNQATSGQWPGTAMEAVGNNWYRAEVPGSCTNIIFSFNGNGQTPDLNVCDGAPFFVNGQFVANRPNDLPAGAKSINDSNDLVLNIYPNPFTTTFEVGGFNGIEGDVTLAIFNLNGQLLHQQAINSNNLRTVDPQLTVSGVYLYQLSSEKGNISTGKLMKL